MAQQIRAPATKFNDLNLIPGTLMLERENRLLQSVNLNKALATMCVVDQRGTIEVSPSLYFTVVELGCGGSGDGDRAVDRLRYVLEVFVGSLG